MIPRSIWTPFLCLPLGAATRADVSLFQGPSGGVGSVVVVDETGARPPSFPAALQGISLVPVDCSGRTELERLSSAKPRLATDVPGASRVLLPHRLGALYRYRRVGAAGTVFGLARVDPSGVAASVWERPGAGPAGTDDPFPARLAVAPAGDAVLVTTTLDAGGDALEIVLASGAVFDHTAGLAPQVFVDGGATLATDWGVACTAGGILRFARGAVGLASAVPFPAGTTWFGGNVAMSADGSRLATVAGPQSTSAHVYVFGRTGAVVQVSTAPGPMANAGYLPENSSGPLLALSPDGTLCVWRTDGVSREAWVRQVAAPQAATVQLTADARFDDTLDNTAEFLWIGPFSLILAVGEIEPLALGAIENADLYQMDFQEGGTIVQRNVTNTSGDTQAPFTASGALETEAGIFAIPGTKRFLAYEDQGGGDGELLEARAGQTGSTVLLSQVKSVDLYEGVGSKVVVSVRRENLDTRELWSYSGGSMTRHLQLDDAFDVIRPRSDGVERFSGTVALGLERWLFRLNLTSGLFEFLSAASLPYGPTLDFTPGGTLVASVDPLPVATIFGAWDPVGGVRLLANGGPGFVLPSE